MRRLRARETIGEVAEDPPSLRVRCDRERSFAAELLTVGGANDHFPETRRCQRMLSVCAPLGLTVILMELFDLLVGQTNCKLQASWIRCIVLNPRRESFLNGHLATSTDHCRCHYYWLKVLSSSSHGDQLTYRIEFYGSYYHFSSNAEFSFILAHFCPLPLLYFAKCCARRWRYRCRLTASPFGIFEGSQR